MEKFVSLTKMEMKIFSLSLRKLREKITQLKWKGEISVNSSRELQLLLSNSIRPDIIEELIDAIKANQNNKIDHTLLSIFVKGLGDKSVALDFKTQKIAHIDDRNAQILKSYHQFFGHRLWPFDKVVTKLLQSVFRQLYHLQVHEYPLLLLDMLLRHH